MANSDIVITIKNEHLQDCKLYNLNCSNLQHGMLHGMLHIVLLRKDYAFKSL